MRQFFKQHKYDCIFTCVLVVMMLAYSFPFLIQQGPKGFHLWRQTDGLSFAKHYYDNGLKFSDPQIFHLLFKDYSSAKTVGEFPGIYYFVACLWKVFGVHEWIFRLVTLLISCAGLFSAYRLIREITQQPFWSSWIVALLFTSPAVAYYAVGFIPDMHAISFTLIACWMFLKYVQSKKWTILYLAAFFFALAGIIKPTALIPFAALGGMLVIESLFTFKSQPTVWFHSKLHSFLAFGFVLVVNLIWILWVRHYNDSFGGWFTPHALFFPWNYPDEVLRNFISMFREFLVNQLFSRTTLFLVISVFAWLVLSWRQIAIKERLVLFFITLGSVAYTLMFFKWDVHDYYALVLIPLPLTIFAIAIGYLNGHLQSLMASKSARLFAIFFLGYNIWYCASNLQMRINPKAEKLYLSSSSKAEVELFKYLMWSYNQKFAAMTEFEPYLKSWGVEEDDLIVSLPDDSFNASLYLMNRRGWTSFESDVLTEAGLRKRILHGAKYLVINDLGAVKSAQLPEVFLQNKIGEFKNLSVYRLSGLENVTLPAQD